jgi:hypothetical protein
MASVNRRVVLKPPGLGESESTQLAETLATAIETQQHLASKSAHVLQLVGNLQENDQAFYVEHEAATPLPIEGLFDPAASGTDEKSLLRLTVALFDALRGGGAGGQKRPPIHGAICPGAILVSPDGIEKVSDFSHQSG